MNYASGHGVQWTSSLSSEVIVYTVREFVKPQQRVIIICRCIDDILIHIILYLCICNIQRDGPANSAAYNEYVYVQFRYICCRVVGSSTFRVLIRLRRSHRCGVCDNFCAEISNCKMWANPHIIFLSALIYLLTVRIYIICLPVTRGRIIGLRMLLVFFYNIPL